MTRSAQVEMLGAGLRCNDPAAWERVRAAIAQAAEDSREDYRFHARACEALGVPLRTWAHWRGRLPELQRECERARAVAVLSAGSSPTPPTPPPAAGATPG